MKLRLPRFRPDRSTLLLLAAIGTGVLAAVAARHYLSDRVAAIEAQARVATVPVVVASRDLAPGTTLSTSTLSVRDVPQTWVQSGAVLPAQFTRVDGQTLGHPLRSGEMLMWTQLESRRAPTFSARVEAGRRAVTVPVDEISSISGLLEPGDLVDLLVTVDRQGRRQTVTVLQNVAVMATGQRSVDDAASGERRLYTTVTLDTDPQQARNLVLARESGRLTALLRNPDDAAPAGEVVADFAQWLAPGASAAATVPTPAAPRGVPVLYGGRGTALAADAAAVRLPAPPPAVETAPTPAAPPTPLGGPPTTIAAGAVR